MTKLIGILILALVVIQLSRPGSSGEEAKAIFLYPPVELKAFSLGYDEIIADTLWIRLLQDYDYCETSSGKKSANAGVTYDQALAAKLEDSRCNKGWVFQMLNLISDLAPRFETVYQNGVANLCVGVDDREGAKILLEKGLAQFPKSWRLAYLGSYVYLFEFQEATRAADLLLQASRFGGPSWFPILASRLYSAAGKKALGRSVIEEFLKSNPPEEGRKRAQERLDALNSAPDQ